MRKEFYQCHRSVSNFVFFFFLIIEATRQCTKWSYCVVAQSRMTAQKNTTAVSSRPPLRTLLTRERIRNLLFSWWSDVCCCRSPPQNPFLLFAFEPPSVAHFFTHSHHSIRDYSTRSTKSTAKCQRHEFSSPNTINKNAKSDKNTRTRANATELLFSIFSIRSLSSSNVYTNRISIFLDFFSTPEFDLGCVEEIISAGLRRRSSITEVTGAAGEHSSN